jgi:hypothetical protein
MSLLTSCSHTKDKKQLNSFIGCSEKNGICRNDIVIQCGDKKIDSFVCIDAQGFEDLLNRCYENKNWVKRCLSF